MANLFAVCRAGGAAVVKRVRVTQGVQNKLEGYFQALETSFFDGIEDEVEFTGDWKPEDDELLVVDAPADAAVIKAALARNPLALPELETARFQNEGIIALFTTTSGPDGLLRRILLQSFSAQQILSRKFAFVLDGDTFKELTEPAFTLGNNLVGVIEGDKLKFKSFHNIRKIFDLSALYRAATDQEIEAFCNHPSLDVPDAVAFRAAADQTIRKLVHTVSKAGTLDQHDVDTIIQKASVLGLALNVNNGKIVIPSEKRDVKILFRFLDDGVYEALLSQVKYQTNSKQRIG